MGNTLAFQIDAFQNDAFQTYDIELDVDGKPSKITRVHCLTKPTARHFFSASQSSFAKTTTYLSAALTVRKTRFAVKRCVTLEVSKER